MYKKKFKNDQDVCWLEHDYMEMKMIIRDQSKNYFHLTPKIGPLWPPPPPTNYGIYHERRETTWIVDLVKV